MASTGDNETSEALLKRAQSGDSTALHELLVAHLGDLQVFIRFNAGAKLAARETVEDLTQSLAGDLLTELERAHFDNLRSFRAWLRRAALSKLIDKQRFHGAERRTADREVGNEGNRTSGFDLRESLATVTTPSQVALGREELSLLERALDLLPDDQRQILTLTRLLGMSHADAAEVLGRNEAACRQLLRRAMLNVAREMEALDRMPD